MEISFKKIPVSSTFKNVSGFIPRPTDKNALADKIYALYKDGLCAALEKKSVASYVDFTQSKIGDLSVFEFTVTLGGKALKFCHVYDGLFPWKMPKAEHKRLCDEIRAQIARRRSFDKSIFADAESRLKSKIHSAVIVPREKGYKVIFQKGVLGESAQIFNEIFLKNT